MFMQRTTSRMTARMAIARTAFITVLLDVEEAQHTLTTAAKRVTFHAIPLRCRRDLHIRTAASEPARCPNCGEDCLVERDHLRRVWVCFVCSTCWR